MTHGRQDARVRGRRPDIKVRAKKVILAMPRRSLELVESDVLRSDPMAEGEHSVGADPERVQAVPGLRISRGGAPSAWSPAARSPTCRFARRTTSAPKREQEGGLPFMNSLLMASYNDISHRAVLEGTGERRRRTRATGRPASSPASPTSMPKMEFPATEEMVQIANRQVAEVHALPGTSDAVLGGLPHLERGSVRRRLARMEGELPPGRDHVPDAQARPRAGHSHRRRGVFLRPGLGGRRAGYGRIDAGGLLRPETSARG